MAQMKWTPNAARGNYWRQADDVLGSKNSMKLGNNTTLRRVGPDVIEVVLHQTPIAAYHRAGEVVLTSGGWRTRTTAMRLNDFAPVRVYTDRGAWMFNDPETQTPTPFEDGLRLKWEEGSSLYLPRLHSGSIAARAARARLFGE